MGDIYIWSVVMHSCLEFIMTTMTKYSIYFPIELLKSSMEKVLKDMEEMLKEIVDLLKPKVLTVIIVSIPSSKFE